MKKTIIILSIDDGRWDMYRLAKEILIPQKIPATFNITTGEEILQKFQSIKKEELIELSKYPFFEFANHSDLHTNDFDDIRKGYLKLCKWLCYDNTVPLGFASPGSKMSIEYIKENINELKKLGVKYIRTCKADYFNKDKDVAALTSYPVKSTTTFEEMKKMTDIAVENKYCLIYLFHSVLKKGEENYDNLWSYDYDKFVQWLSYVKELQNHGKLDIMTTMDYVDMQLGNI